MDQLWRKIEKRKVVGKSTGISFDNLHGVNHAAKLDDRGRASLAASPALFALSMPNLAAQGALKHKRNMGGL